MVLLSGPFDAAEPAALGRAGDPPRDTRPNRRRLRRSPLRSGGSRTAGSAAARLRASRARRSPRSSGQPPAKGGRNSTVSPGRDLDGPGVAGADRPVAHEHRADAEHRVQPRAGMQGDRAVDGARRASPARRRGRRPRRRPRRPGPPPSSGASPSQPDQVSVVGSMARYPSPSAKDVRAQTCHPAAIRSCGGQYEHPAAADQRAAALGRGHACAWPCSATR